MADFWKRFSRNRQAVLGLIILSVVIFVAAIANIIYPGDPFLYSKFPLSAPGENGFLLGSDSIGRDVASGIAHGAKTSLLIGLIATLAAVFIGGTPTWGGVGTIVGAVFGVGVIAYMEVGVVAMGMSGVWRQFFNGLIIILAILGHRFHGGRVR